MSDPVPEWHNVDAQTFRQRIFPSNRPAVLRGLVAGWRAVAEGQKSPQATAEYLLGLEQGGPLSLLTAPPSIKGRFFYRDDMRSPNFERRPAPLAAGLHALVE